MIRRIVRFFLLGIIFLTISFALSISTDGIAKTTAEDQQKITIKPKVELCTNNGNESKLVFDMNKNKKELSSGTDATIFSQKIYPSHFATTQIVNDSYYKIDTNYFNRDVDSLLTRLDVEGITYPSSDQKNGDWSICLDKLSFSFEHNKPMIGKEHLDVEWKLVNAPQ